MLNTTRAVDEIKRGLLDRAIFGSEEIHQRELEQIFARCWLFLGHESQAPQPNDFFTTYMGEDNVIVWRSGNGTLRAFLNMCRHRGNQLCRADGGNAASFMCTYHGWNFRSDGTLAHVPDLQEMYGGELDFEKLGLIQVAQLDTYKGLIFGTFDPGAPPLIDYIGRLKPTFDFVVDRRAGGTELLGGVHKWIIKTNWKYPADNFSGDDGHHYITHASVRKVPVDAVDYKTTINQYDRFVAEPGPLSAQAPSDERTEKAIASTPTGVLRDYARRHLPEAVQRIGEDAYRGGVVDTLFPNFSINSGRHMVRVWHPRGPFKTELWSYCIVDREAPQDVKDELRRHLTQTFGPAGNFEQDDFNNWFGCTQTARGAVARRYPQHITAGLTDAPVAVNGRFLGGKLREFYLRHAVMMEASNWSEINIRSDDWT